MKSLDELFPGIPKAEEFASVGRFISNCSYMETGLHILARSLMKINENTARLLLGEPRVGELTTLIKNFIDLRKVKRKKHKYLNALSWAEYINRIRSVVAHKPFHMHEGKMIFHNAFTAKFLKRSWHYDCSVIELEKCSVIALDAASLFVDVLKVKYISNDLPIYEKGRHSPAWLQKLGLPDDPEKIQNPTPESNKSQPQSSPA